MICTKSNNDHSYLKKAAVALLLSIFFVSNLILFGCTPKEGEVQEAAEQKLELLQKKDLDTAHEVFESVYFYPEDYGVTSDLFAKTYFEGFTYSIDKIDIPNKTTAYVTITVSATDTAEFLGALEEAQKIALSKEPQSYDTGYADEAFKEISTSYSWQNKKLTGEYTLIFNEKEGWLFEDPSGLSALILDGYDPRQIL